MSNKHFIWDSYSDQPQVIKDRAFKKATRRKELKDNLKLFFTSIFILPISIIIMKFLLMNLNKLNLIFLQFFYLLQHNIKVKILMIHTLNQLIPLHHQLLLLLFLISF